MDVSQLISQMYNQPAASNSDAPTETTKFAHGELFLKLATEQGIELDKLSAEQTEDLYNRVFKTAGEMPPQFQKKDGEGKKDEKKDDDEDEKKAAAAAAYVAEKTAFAEKVAEFDLMGRVVAHAFLDELKKEGGIPPQFMNAGKKDGDKGGDDKSEKDDDEDEKKKESAAHAFETLARRHAVELAKTAGFDPAQVQKKVDAVAELGLLQESTKIAGLQANQAVAIRGYEYLEKIGFEVNWKELQG